MRANRAITSLVLACALAAVSTPAAAALVGYWPLDGDATAAVGTHGVLVNGPTPTTDRNGAAGGGLAFDGSLSQYVSVPGGGGLNAQATATVSMWVQWNGTQDNGHGNRHGAVLGRQKNTQWSDNVLCLYNQSNPDTSNINWETRLGAGMNSGTAAGDGTWRHVAVTVSPAGEKLYVDGDLKATRGAVGGFHSDASIPLTIGAWIGDGNSYSTSRIDDVAIWNEELTSTQVAALADQTAAPLAQAIRPLSVRASSELTAGHNRRAANAADGVGQATTTTNDWPGEVGGMWLSAAGDTTPTITFDLGGVHDLDAMVIHNYNESILLSRGVQAADVLVSTDHVTYTPAGSISLAPATGNASNPGQYSSLAGLQARYIRLAVTANHGDGSYTGLNEVAFHGRALERMPIAGVTATASSSLNSGNPNGGFHRVGGYLVDGTGLFADGHTASPESGMWLSAGVGFGGTPGDDGDPEVVFDLGAVHERVDSVRIWNYNESNLTARGVATMDILGSADGVNYVLLLDDSEFALAQAPGADGVDFSEWLDLDAQGIRYITFDIASNHRGVTFPATSGADNAFVGLSEVRFYGTQVPEPASLALLGLAAAGLGGYVRRRRLA